MIIDHIGIGVKDYAESRNFYVKALAPLGIEIIMEVAPNGQKWCGMGQNQKAEFWFGEAPHVKQQIDFLAKDSREVEAFYQAAISAGAKDNGSPGLRPKYHPNYYGAFVIDPNGYNIEAVCHDHTE